MSNDINIPSDEELTAFIDGELPPQDAARIEALLNADERVAARLEFLSRSNLPFKDSFAPLLAAAPQASLESMLAAILSKQEGKAPSFMSRRGFLGALAASVVAGVIADRAYLGISRNLSKDEGAEWRAVVAEYISLYTPDTLAGPVPPADVQSIQLAQIDRKLGLALSPGMVALQGVDFKRVLLLEYDEKPLAQIAYLDPETGPMALCIIRSDKGEKTPDIEGRNGMNVIYWSSRSHAFMLIGHAPADRMQEIVDNLRSKLTA
ncbi:twin-arginine translocation signal domain-containing protein [Rhizobium sullae]|uniref:Fis family transcriptional regulator n=1 Tax=Rhizobium sullae TaxID=50338 RepID=A0A2N0D4A9_RHISU|nr:twin-arginine translocation signal domain-containing protein [Rhizobium sullae]PKA40951.1 Fis family transcriptional regulator [Rhizobium sullae]UWU14795.1 twin-arginine translocation signal domain-containing protein [Rhizobium sullae]